MPEVDFPALVPSSRSYQPGVFPETKFEAQNGAVVRVRYGNQRTNSRLTLTFSNITDANANSVLENYVNVTKAGDYVVFTASNVARTTTSGEPGALTPWFRETNSVLKWKYASPPSVQSVKPGLSTVSCEFVGELEGI